jgi:hypothetical protein
MAKDEEMRPKDVPEEIELTDEEFAELDSITNERISELARLVAANIKVERAPPAYTDEEVKELLSDIRATIEKNFSADFTDERLKEQTEHIVEQIKLELRGRPRNRGRQYMPVIIKFMPVSGVASLGVSYPAEEMFNRFRSALSRAFKQPGVAEMLKKYVPQIGVTAKIPAYYIMQFLGYDENDMADHMEAQLEANGWDWTDLFGGGLHIDHIIPIAGVDLTNIDNFIKVFSLANLQPLPGMDNIRKGIKIE